MDSLTAASNTVRSVPLLASRRRFDIIVVVPARNEEKLIGACLASVLDALSRAAQVIDRVAIVAVADGCTDRTCEIANAVLGSQPLSLVTECDLGNVALVRSLGVHVGRRLLGSTRSDRTWMASTDADTTVPDDWLLHHLAAASRGIRAVAGVVEIESFDGLPAIAPRVFAENYTDLLLPEGDHPHVHAANLGVRLDAYDDSGGWGCLPRSEDRDLWTRLQRVGARVESPRDLRVVTSGRAIGRVPGGFAECLREQVLVRERRNAGHEGRRSA